MRVLIVSLAVQKIELHKQAHAGPVKVVAVSLLSFNAIENSTLIIAAIAVLPQHCPDRGWLLCLPLERGNLGL